MLRTLSKSRKPFVPKLALQKVPLESTHIGKASVAPERPELYRFDEVIVDTLMTFEPTILPRNAVEADIEVPEIAPDDATDVHPTEVAPDIVPFRVKLVPEMVFPAEIGPNTVPQRMFEALPLTLP